MLKGVFRVFAGPAPGLTRHDDFGPFGPHFSEMLGQSIMDSIFRGSGFPFGAGEPLAGMAGYEASGLFRFIFYVEQQRRLYACTVKYT